MLRMEFTDNGCSASLVDVIALASRDADPTAAVVRNLARNELLFEAGDIKTKIYRVETGAICVYRTRADLTIEVIEHVLAGDLIGLGFLDRHSANARATVETKVRCFDLDAVDDLIDNDAHNKARHHDAIEREFAFRRESLAKSARERPMVRLAAFLVAVSHRIGDEGGDPALIDDTVDCGVIADFLGLSVDLLALALMQLEMRGLVETAPPHGLRLKDISALEDIAAERTDVPLTWAAPSNEELLAAIQ
ncbi:Crp/Fnr family transcriptional regulator [Hyphomicrobium sp.]|jgi:CRP/FNR family transcriptional regulator|uniref:Crp/Fnr family transcriptional regulator n=1 Tax=Hyphomicrobium sp. TaxID=82 RepID=UPI0035655B49